MIQHIVGISLQFGIQTVFLVAGLWIMIKIQKFDYNVLGLIGSAILASGLDMIPYIGHYVSAAVLLLCIRNVIVADSYTDALFTVAIGYALMFCLNLFLIGALLGDLKPMMPVKAESKEPDGDIPSAAILSQTNQTTAETVSAKEPEEKAQPVIAMTNPPPIAQKTEIAAPVAIQPDPKTNDVSAPVLALNMVSKFRLIGVSGGGNHPLAMIRTGTKTESVSRNESIQVETAKGWVSVRCDEVSGNKVVLNVAGQKITLSMY
jgi:hypothetical protein